MNISDYIMIPYIVNLVKTILISLGDSCTINITLFFYIKWPTFIAMRSFLVNCSLSQSPGKIVVSSTYLYKFQTGDY